MPKNSNYVNDKEMLKYINYLLTGEVADEKEAKLLGRIGKRDAKISDVVVLIQSLLKGQEHVNRTLMETISVQKIVLRKLGATDETFEEAKKEYIDNINEQVDAARKAAEEAQKAQQEAEEKGEDE